MGEYRTNATSGSIGAVGNRVYRAILMRQRNGTDVCDLRHESAYRAVMHMVEGNGLPFLATAREYSSTLRRLKSEIDLGDGAEIKRMLHSRLLDHLKKHRRAGRTDIRFGYSGGSRNQNCLKFFGYTLTDLMHHLTQQFSDGMTWARLINGEVQMDHILPARLFNLTNLSGIRKAYALDNLQPLWRGDNAKKGRTSDLELIKLFGDGTIHG